MKCPKCKKELSEKIKIGDVEIDRCPECGGLWFEKDELRLAKDKKAPEAKWVDIEIEDKSINWFQFKLWKDKGIAKGDIVHLFGTVPDTDDAEWIVTREGYISIELSRVENLGYGGG